MDPLLLISIPLILLGSFVTLYNGLVFVQQFHKMSSPSPAPVVGGILFSIGLYIFPNFNFSYYAIVPIFLDLGCAFYTIGVTCCTIREVSETSARNLVHQFNFVEAARSTEVSLFKKSIAVLVFKSGTTIISRSCRWTKNENMIEIECGESFYRVDISKDAPSIVFEKTEELQFSILGKQFNVV